MELQPQQGYADWTNMLKLLYLKDPGHISYANCGLPYYIGDVITDPEDLTLQTPESFFKRFRINMKIHHEVISIHPDRKTVSVKNLENDEIFEETYDKLILSPGAKPTQPNLPGVGLDNLFTLRTVEDTIQMKEYINKNHPQVCCTGWWWFYWFGAGRKFKRAWHGCYDHPAS